MALSKEAILGAVDIKTVPVEVPELGGIVNIRGLTGRQRDAFESGLFSGEGKDRSVNRDNMRARLLVLCIVDDEGKRIFDDADAVVLGQKSAAALDRLFDVAQELSGLGPKAIEETKKN